MRRLTWLSLLALLLLPPSASWSAAGRPSFRKVLVVVLENTDYADALRQPGLASLAAKGATLSAFLAETHPSQPNYLALVTGSTQGVRDDGKVDIDPPSIADLLEAKGRTWKAYLEGYPGNCFLGERSGRYARKHNPFASLAGIQRAPGRCARMVPAGQLAKDIREGSLPDFALYVPDLDDDGHDTGPAYASRWLSEKLLPQLGDPLPEGLLLVVTFDESSSVRKENRVLTVLYGDGVRPGSVSSAPYDHYSILRTIEDRFGLGTLAKNDEHAHAISDVWR